MKLYGSLNNRLMEVSKMPIPTVGMGVTFLHYTDRDAGTIIEVRNSRTIVVQEDIATRTDTNEMSESQSYTFSPNPNGPKGTYTLRKNGQWVKRGIKMNQGGCLLIGHRSKYYDYSF